MNPFMALPDLFSGPERTISIDSTKENPSVTYHQAPYHHHFAEPDHTGPNMRVVGTGTGHAMNLGRRNRGMDNKHNSLPYMNPDQQAGNSQPSNEGNKADPKKLAKQLRDRKYREKKKEEMICLKRKADELTERNESLENENASLKKDVDRLEKALKKCDKDVHQLKDKHDGLTTTITEISKALTESKYVEVQHENEQLKYENAVLINQINNLNTMDMIHLLAKNAQLESEVSSRQLVIDSLCKKMKTDS